MASLGYTEFPEFPEFLRFLKKFLFYLRGTSTTFRNDLKVLNRVPSGE